MTSVLTATIEQVAKVVMLQTCILVILGLTLDRNTDSIKGFGDFILFFQANVEAVPQSRPRPLLPSFKFHFQGRALHGVTPQKNSICKNNTLRTSKLVQTGQQDGLPVRYSKTALKGGALQPNSRELSYELRC
jgi:hypothetical protein